MFAIILCIHVVFRKLLQYVLIVLHQIKHLYQTMYFTRSGFRKPIIVSIFVRTVGGSTPQQLPFRNLMKKELKKPPALNSSYFEDYQNHFSP